MGIYNRDYIRENPGQPRFGGGIGSVCKWLIIANVVVFVLQMATGGDHGLVTSWLKLGPQDLQRGQIWRLVTYAFCHSEDFLHILFNMLFIWWFGKALEERYGSREFLFFYLAAAVSAGLVYILMRLTLRELGSVYGASGATMAVAMLYALHFPRQKILFWGILPIEVRWLVALFVVQDTWPVLQSLAGQGSNDNIAHAAHLGGLAFGYWYKKRGLRLEYFWANLRWPKLSSLWRPRSKIRVYRPPVASTQADRKDANSTELEFEQKLDAILDKIHKQGKASLTDRERSILDEASRFYRNR
jgi:membrane associated rhomboid family serine protease